uniref:PlsC domain-containing protein n=1 Tax=Rhabditophanes sp. KR3021 TaxID=114890 RepID=A0AC35TME7_9BILA
MTGDVMEVQNSRGIMHFIYMGLAFVWLFMTAIIVPIACVLTRYVVLTPIKLFSVRCYNYLENRLCFMVNEHWVSTSAFAGMNVIEYGDDISDLCDERVLLLPNHLGLVDHFIVMTAMYNKGLISGRWLFVIYNIWFFTPLGILWDSHNNFFINGGADKREVVLEEFEKHIKKYYWANDFRFIVMYPEGSRFYLIKESGAKFAEKNNLPLLRHCCYPRIGAAKTILKVAGPKDEKGLESNSDSGPPLTYLIDCTLGYPKGNVVDIRDALYQNWPENNKTMGIHYKVHKITPELCDEKNLTEFLYKCYQDKDELLEYYYKHDSFPGSSNIVYYPNNRIIVAECFWLCMFFFTYFAIMKPCVWLIYYLFTLCTDRVFAFF